MFNTHFPEFIVITLCLVFVRIFLMDTISQSIYFNQ